MLSLNTRDYRKSKIYRGFCFSPHLSPPTTPSSVGGEAARRWNRTRKAGVEGSAWKAMTEKYNDHTKDPGQDCHEELVSTKMEPGQDPDDFRFVLNEYRDLLEEIGLTVHNERVDGRILQALPHRHERVRTTSCERRDLEVDDIRHIVHTVYIDNLSR
eukprot:jgi/Undpi1/6344/HiC_scaffold_20.g08827.m1